MIHEFGYEKKKEKNDPGETNFKSRHLRRRSFWNAKRKNGKLCNRKIFNFFFSVCVQLRPAGW